MAQGYISCLLYFYFSPSSQGRFLNLDSTQGGGQRGVCSRLLELTGFT